MKIAIFPGSFDPLTNGHLDIIKRSSTLFDKLIVLISENSEKKTLFTIDERKKLISDNVMDINNVSVDICSSLTVTYAKKHKACAIIRGVRTIKDYEYEQEIAAANYYLDPDIETVLLFSSSQYANVSSSIVREMMKYHADVHGLVSEGVELALLQKYESK